MRSRRVQHNFRWFVVGTVPVILASVAVLLATYTSVVYAQCGGTIRSGSSVSSNIRSGSWCDYTFEGTKGSVVTIKMTRSSSTLDPFLELRGPRGPVVSDDDSAGDRNSLISNYPLPETGRYIIRARSYDSREYGEFTLQFQMNSGGANCGGSIQANTWLNNQQLSAPGQNCRYTFQGAQGRTVSIAMAKQGGSSLDAYLDLVDPSGSIVASDDDSYGGSDALIKDFRLRQTGQYTIIARSYNNASAGTFSIFLQY